MMIRCTGESRFLLTSRCHGWGEIWDGKWVVSLCLSEAAAATAEIIISLFIHLFANAEQRPPSEMTNFVCLLPCLFSFYQPWLQCYLPSCLSFDGES